jgi:hypothetical protein
LCDRNAVSDSCAGRSAFGKESQKTSSHRINFCDTFNGGSAAGWFEFFEDGVTAYVNGFDYTLFSFLCEVFTELRGDIIDGAPVVQDMFSHFFLILAHKFPIGPDRVLRTVHLVHDEGHQKAYKGVNGIIDLLNIITTRNGLLPDVGSKEQGE